MNWLLMLVGVALVFIGLFPRAAQSAASKRPFARGLFIFVGLAILYFALPIAYR